MFFLCLICLRSQVHLITSTCQEIILYHRHCHFYINCLLFHGDSTASSTSVADLGSQTRGCLFVRDNLFSHGSRQVINSTTSIRVIMFMHKRRRGRGEGGFSQTGGGRRRRSLMMLTVTGYSNYCAMFLVSLALLLLLVLVPTMTLLLMTDRGIVRVGR